MSTSIRKRYMVDITPTKEPLSRRETVVLIVMIVMVGIPAVLANVLLLYIAKICK